MVTGSIHDLAAAIPGAATYPDAGHAFRTQDEAAFARRPLAFLGPAGGRGDGFRRE